MRMNCTGAEPTESINVFRLKEWLVSDTMEGLVGVVGGAGGRGTHERVHIGVCACVGVLCVDTIQSMFSCILDWLLMHDHILLMIVFIPQ